VPSPLRSPTFRTPKRRSREPPDRFGIADLPVALAGFGTPRDRSARAFLERAHSQASRVGFENSVTRSGRS
jgi:hypothetical protein